MPQKSPVAVILRKLAILSIGVTLFGARAWAQSSAATDLLNGFRAHLVATQTKEFRKSLTRGKPVGKVHTKSGEPMSLHSQGGWNGTGGGGGLACYANEEVLNSNLHPDGRAKWGWLNDIQSFQMLELYDAEESVQWPAGDFDPAALIRERILSRLAPTFPVLSESLLAELESIGQAPWFELPTLSVLRDYGPLVSGKKPPKNCLYAQWAHRYQNTEMQVPVSVLALNKSLDDRLRELLGPREYRIQRTVLNLHEAISGIFLQRGLKDSGYTRSLIDLLLMNEEKFAKEILNPTINGLFWNFWVREILPSVSQSAKNFAEFQSVDGRWTDAVSAQWSAYQTFLTKMELALEMVRQFMIAHKIPPVPSTLMADPTTAVHDNFVRGMVFIIFASDWKVLMKNPDIPERIRDLEGFYLLASELEAQKKIVSLQVLALSEPTADAWTRACKGVEDVEQEWRLAPTPTDADAKAKLGVGRWVAMKALRHCRSRLAVTK